MALAHKHREPFQGVLTDRVEYAGGIAVPEITAPAAQEPVEILYDPFVGQQQPLPLRQLTDPVAGMLGRLAGQPARSTPGGG